jgi:hypothetical protein
VITIDFGDISPDESPNPRRFTVTTLAAKVPFSQAIVPLLAVLLSACGPEAGKPKGPPEGPFAVSEYFAASGAMGDGATEGNLVTSENKNCKERPAGARGNCYAFDYTPNSILWAGVYWQYPANNWGADPGLPLPEGLTKISFQAAVLEAPAGGERMKFAIGGIGVPPLPVDATDFPNDDQFKYEEFKYITTDWQAFEFMLPPPIDPNLPIASLIGAFAWYANYPEGADFTTLAPKTIYIDDIYYE